jgi:hypothetical protein
MDPLITHLNTNRDNIHKNILELIFMFLVRLGSSSGQHSLPMKTISMLSLMDRK